MGHSVVSGHPMSTSLSHVDSWSTDSRVFGCHKQEKLSLKYIRPFEVLERVGTVDYWLV